MHQWHHSKLWSGWETKTKTQFPEEVVINSLPQLPSLFSIFSPLFFASLLFCVIHMFFKCIGFYIKISCQKVKNIRLVSWFSQLVRASSFLEAVFNVHKRIHSRFSSQTLTILFLSTHQNTSSPFHIFTQLFQRTLNGPYAFPQMHFNGFGSFIQGDGTKI